MLVVVVVVVVYNTTSDKRIRCVTILNARAHTIDERIVISTHTYVSYLYTHLYRLIKTMMTNRDGGA